MSYVTLATNSFDEVARFYGADLGFPVVGGWDRDNGRGRRFDLGGLTLEVLDNARERKPLPLPADRFHLVVEVDDILVARSRLRISAPPPQPVTWGAAVFQIRDPERVPVTFLEWNSAHL
jgi:catechol 2,3-dioxygenase-like lactoylglutathione lyase family enzyme